MVPSVGAPTGGVITISAAPPSSFVLLCVTWFTLISDGCYRLVLCLLLRRCRGPLQRRRCCPPRRLASRPSQHLAGLTASRSAPACRFVKGNCHRYGPSPPS